MVGGDLQNRKCKMPNLTRGSPRQAPVIRQRDRQRRVAGLLKLTPGQQPVASRAFPDRFYYCAAARSAALEREARMSTQNNKARYAVTHWIRFSSIVTPDQLALTEHPPESLSWKIGPDGPVGPDGYRLPSNIWCGVIFRSPSSRSGPRRKGMLPSVSCRRRRKLARLASANRPSRRLQSHRTFRTRADIRYRISRPGRAAIRHDDRWIQPRTGA